MGEKGQDEGSILFVHDIIRFTSDLANAYQGHRLI